MMEDGKVVEKDRTDELVALFRKQGLDALVAIGGDGSLEIGQRAAPEGPERDRGSQTIDNDLDRTVVTFGFDTGRDSPPTASIVCTRRPNLTSASWWSRSSGRYAGWIALHAGVAASPDAILHPEDPLRHLPVADKIAEREAGRDIFRSPSG